MNNEEWQLVLNIAILIASIVNSIALINNTKAQKNNSPNRPGNIGELESGGQSGPSAFMRIFKALIAFLTGISPSVLYWWALNQQNDGNSSYLLVSIIYTLLVGISALFWSISKTLDKKL